MRTLIFPAASSVTVSSTTEEPFTIEFTDSDSSGTDGTEFTFADLALGTESASRRIVVVAASRKATPGADISAFTIAGVAATRVGTLSTNQGNSIVMFIADVPTGTTGSVVVTWDATVLRSGISVYALKGAGSAVESAAATSTAAAPTATLAIPVGGGAIAGAYTAANTTSTLTNLTEDVDLVIETATMLTTGHNVTDEGDTEMTFTFGVSTAPVGIFAVWAP